MSEEFDHDALVAALQKNGHMAESDQPETPGYREFQEGSLEQPVLDDESLSAGESVESTVEVKYLGHGAYEANGVEVRRNGQTVSVNEATATELTGLTDDEGNALFERV